MENKRKMGTFVAILLLVNVIFNNNLLVAYAQKLTGNDIQESVVSIYDETKNQETLLEIKEESKEVLLGGYEEIELTTSDKIEKYEIVWTSSNNEVASVNCGIISGNKEGEAVITVSLKTEDKEYKDEIVVKVVRNLGSEVQAMAQEDLYEFVCDNDMTYEVYNDSNEKLYLNSVGNRSYYNIVSYNSSGNISYMRINDYGNISVSPGEKIRLRYSKGNELKLAVQNKYREYIKSNTLQLFSEVKFDAGKAYELENSTDSVNYIIAEGNKGYYETISYYADRRVSSMNIRRYCYGSLSIGKDYITKYKFEEDATFYIPYELKDELKVKELDSKLFAEVKFEAGKAYEIENSTDKVSYITKEDNKVYYETILYYTDRRVRSMSIRDSSYSSLSIGEDYIRKYKFEEDVTFYIPYELKDELKVKELDSKLFSEVKFEAGKAYEIENSTDKVSYITKEENKVYYETISYYTDRRVSYMNTRDSSYGSLSIGKDYIRKYKFEEDVTFYIPYELKDELKVKELDSKLFAEVKFEAGKAYELENSTDKVSYITKEDNKVYYETILYYIDRRIKSMSTRDYSYSSLSIGKDYIRKYKFEEDVTFYIPYELKDDLKMLELGYKNLTIREDIENDRVYFLENGTAYDSKILTTSTSDNRYDITYYDQNDKIISSKTNIYGDIEIKSGEKIAVSSTKGELISLYIPHELVDEEGVSILNVKVKNNYALLWSNVLSSEYRVSYKDDENKQIEVNVDWKGEKPGKIYLKQGNKSFASTDGKFNLAVGKEFDAGVPIYAVATTDSGIHSIAKELKLKVLTNTHKIEDKLKLDGISLGSTSGDTPIMGSSSVGLEFEGFKYSIKTDYETGIVKVIFGVEDKKGADFDKDFNAIKSELKQVFSPVTYSLIKKFGVSSSAGVCGYGQGKIVNGNLVLLDGKINLDLATKFSYETNTFLAGIPVYAVLGMDVKSGINAPVSSESGLLQLRKTEVNISPAILAESGIGRKGIISIGLDGKLQLNANLSFDPFGEQCSLYGYMGIKTTAFIYEKDISIQEREWMLSEKSGKASLDLDDVDIYNSENYSLEPREYLKSTSEWLSDGTSETANISSRSNELIEVLQTSVLPTTEPIIAEVKGKKVLVWTSDNETRNSINRSELVYSIYDKANGIWSSPKAVSDDKTADFYPQIASDGNDLFVVWQNMKKELNDSATLEEMSSNSEIVVSRFNTSNDSFSKPTTLTNNNVYDGSANIAVNDGKAYVTWTRNDSNDIFGIKGNDKLLASSFNGDTWSEEEVILNNVNNVTSFNMKYNGDEVYIVYDVDGDGDYNTTSDKEIYYITSENTTPVRITNNDYMDSNPQIISNENGLGLVWYSNGNLVNSNTISGAKPEKIFVKSSYDGTDNFKVIQDDENMAIVWTKNLDESVEVCGALYDSTNKAISERIQLTNLGQRVKTVNGIFDDNGDILLSLNAAESIKKSNDKITYYVDGNSNLELLNVKLSYDISVDKDKSYVNDGEFIVGKKLPINLKIENIGQLFVNQVNVEVLADGEVNSSKVIDVALKLGENKEINTDFTVKQAKSSDIEVRVTPIEGNDRYMDDNIINFKVGSSDLAIERINDMSDKTKNILSVVVANKSSINPGKATINIRKDSSDGEVIQTVDLDTIESGKELEKIIELDSSKLNYDENNESLIYVEVVTKEEKNKENNIEPIIIYKQFVSEDINKDGSVDIFDMSVIANKYNSNVKQDNWDYFYDMNLDGIIDIYDIVSIGRKIS